MKVFPAEIAVQASSIIDCTVVVFPVTVTVITTLPKKQSVIEFLYDLRKRNKSVSHK